MIAREKNPKLEMEAKTEKAQRNVTKRKIKNEMEAETEKKRMRKTNESRYCSFVSHQAKINAKGYMICPSDSYYASY